MEQFIVEGSVEDIIFENKDNGYGVFQLDMGEEEVVCVGYVGQIHSGEHVKIMGSWIVHPTYGKQFQVDVLEKQAPTTEEGIEKYLSSGIIKGIGKKMAKKIVDVFGKETFVIIEEDPEKLSSIKGISLRKAQQISEVFHQQIELRNTVMALQQYGLSPVYAMKIYKKYKKDSLTLVRNNPYRLADDIFGIGFKIADKIAASVGFDFQSPYRVKAGIQYVLNQFAAQGNTYLPKEFLIQQVEVLLNIPLELIDHLLLEMQVDKLIYLDRIDGLEAVYLSTFYYAENHVAARLMQLSVKKEASFDIPYAIAQYEKFGIQLAKHQKEAVAQAMTEGVLVITGGPGTGKTTIINAIIQILEKNYEIVLAAPTGRAAKRMTEATGIEAKTIHRLLELTYLTEDSRAQNFIKDESNPIEADVIIIDEVSMVDILLMNSLLKAIPQQARLVLVGDMDQLPSVGAGNVLKDIIQSETIPVVRLTEIFRQAQESAIVMNAHRINNGQYPVLNEKGTDFFFIQRVNVVELEKEIVGLVTKRLPSYASCENVMDIQVLTPMRKSPIGVQHLNKVLQNALNPPRDKKMEKEFRETLFREGDKVMQIKNNYHLSWKMLYKGRVTEEGLGIFNGDCGIVTLIDNFNEELTVTFDDGKVVVYEYPQLDELELSYAITIHKSQGSEYPVVVIPVHSGPPMLMTRNLLYTAVTRAVKLVVIVGVKETMQRMIDNTKEVQRYSALNVQLKHFKNVLGE